MYMKHMFLTFFVYLKRIFLDFRDANRISEGLMTCVRDRDTVTFGFSIRLSFCFSSFFFEHVRLA